VDWIADKPWTSLKFMDESSFSSRDLLRQKGIAPIGEDEVIANDFSDPDETWSVSLMTTLDPDAIHPFVLGPLH